MPIIGQQVANQLDETWYKHPCYQKFLTNGFKCSIKYKGHSFLLDIHGRVSLQMPACRYMKGQGSQKTEESGKHNSNPMVMHKGRKKRSIRYTMQSKQHMPSSKILLNQAEFELHNKQ